jgi:hypothetical protein
MKTRPQMKFGMGKDGTRRLTFVAPLTGRAEWTVESQLAVQDGRVVIAEVRVSPARWQTDPAQSGEQAGLAAYVPPGGLTSRLLRQVPVGAYVDLWGATLHPREPEEAAVAADVRRLLAWHDPALGNSRWRSRPPARPPGAKRPGRRPLADDVLVEAAAAYIAARKGGSRRPVPDAARALNMTEARMRDLVYRARRRRLLSEARQGRGGGDLTPEGRKLLRMVRRRLSRGRKRR